MRKIYLFLLLSLFSFLSCADEYVSGYFKKDGTYVEGYFRSSPNSTNRDNYSTQGNITSVRLKVE
jgi:hypothetical protein